VSTSTKQPSDDEIADAASALITLSQIPEDGGGSDSRLAEHAYGGGG